MNLRLLEAAGGQKIQLSQIELEIVLNERYIILVYDTIVIVWVRC